MPTGWDKQMPVQKTVSSQSTSDKVIDNEVLIRSDKVSEMNRLETFIPEEPRRSLNDLIIPKSVRARIDSALNRIRFYDELYNQWNLKKIDPYGCRIAINLFGSPGTGKTFCAEAIAHHLKRKIIKVNYAEIESKYVGETPKNITAAFRKALETNSVLFFDEADSILGKRLTNVTQSADHGVNVSRSVMLLELDKFDGIVVFATNLAKNYDGAFVRRILAHIEFELPDEECRLRLWQYLIPLEVPRSSAVTFEWLAKESEGLSGGDICNVVISAASRAVERITTNREVSRDDLLEEIKHIRTSKQKISSEIQQKHPIILTEKKLEPEELPPDVQEKFQEVSIRQYDNNKLGEDNCK
jgi:SpoVK/Ycf46/Vps4 family AAA+-type ATPase